ncbi:hypothetical protein KC361_g232 [Hortaea werneckii]|nr:hypothetical protein KC361_g232 [Hortaea werneckii]
MACVSFPISKLLLRNMFSTAGYSAILCRSGNLVLVLPSPSTTFSPPERACPASIHFGLAREGFERHRRHLFRTLLESLVSLKVYDFRVGCCESQTRPTLWLQPVHTANEEDFFRLQLAFRPSSVIIIPLHASPYTVNCAIRMALDVASLAGEARIFQPAESLTSTRGLKLQLLRQSDNTSNIHFVD